MGARARFRTYGARVQSRDGGAYRDDRPADRKPRHDGADRGLWPEFLRLWAVEHGANPGPELLVGERLADHLDAWVEPAVVHDGIFRIA